MIYLIPTKRGLGVELWGTFDDLDNFYGMLSKFWSRPGFEKNKAYRSRDNLISGFSYAIRKATQGSELTSTTSHYSGVKIDCCGVRLTWVHVLFSLTAIRYNTRLHEMNKQDLALLLHVEYWLEQAMRAFDLVGAEKLSKFIDGGIIHESNDYLYQFMRSIDNEFIQLGGGKRAFRSLPDLLQRSVYNSHRYNRYLKELEAASEEFKCKIEDLEINDDLIDWENLKW